MVLKIVSLVCATVFLVVFVLAMLSLAQFRVERQMTMNAPAGVIFPYINDFRRGDEWSPWLKLDPAMKITYGTPSSGVGAHYEWDGNKNAGAGMLDIIESVPDDHVTLAMKFIRPMPGDATVIYRLQPATTGTTMTWTMTGPSPTLVSRIMMYFCKGMMEKTFDEGLMNLKTIVEKGPH